MATIPTIKALSLLSGNLCAYPGCSAPIIDSASGVIVGEIAHIKAQGRKGPRFDANQSKDEREGFHNLMFMCNPHHTIIDDKSQGEVYTVEVLQDYKRTHESKFANTIITDDFVERLVIRFIELYAPKPTVPGIVPIVRTDFGQVYEGHQDTYGFYVKLRNNGDVTVKEFRVEIELPDAYAARGKSMAEVENHERPGVRLYRHTERHMRDFILYPGETSYDVLSVGFWIRPEHYKEMKDVITVILYWGDNKISRTEYPMAEFLHPERLKKFS